MNWYGNYVGFPRGMTDKEILMAMPEKLKELFTGLLPCMNNVDWSTLTFVVHHYTDDGDLLGSLGLAGIYSATVGMKFKAE